MTIHRILVLTTMSALVATGCASTGASVKSLAAAEKPADLGEYRNLAVQVTKADGVEVSGSDMARIAGRIVAAIRKKQPDRFSEIEVGATDDAAPTVDVGVKLARYDRGNAFARFMLAGLGQIHIDAQVTLHDHLRDAVLGDYEVTKTFAWGGIYGASTGIEDVEVGFAEGVADVVLNRESR